MSLNNFDVLILVISELAGSQNGSKAMADPGFSRRGGTNPKGGGAKLSFWPFHEKQEK